METSVPDRVPLLRAEQVVKHFPIRPGVSVKAVDGSDREMLDDLLSAEKRYPVRHAFPDPTGRERKGCGRRELRDLPGRNSWSRWRVRLRQVNFGAGDHATSADHVGERLFRGRRPHKARGREDAAVPASAADDLPGSVFISGPPDDSR